MFNPTGNERLCINCREDALEDLARAKDFLTEHPGATMVQLSNELGISINQIKEWIREERIEFVAGENSEFKCHTCGRPIMSGRFCKKCIEKISNDLKNVAHSYESKNEANEFLKDRHNKMRYF